MAYTSLKRNITIYLLVMCCLLTACGKNDNQDKKSLPVTKVVSALPKNVENTYYFSGVIMPRKHHNITAPAAAVIEEIYFEYGQKIKKGEQLFLLNSEELAKQYRSMLTEYLQAKDKLVNAKRRYKSAKELWHLGIVSDESYSADKSNYDSSHISCLRAKFNLEELLKRSNSSINNLGDLKLSDFSAVDKALQKHSSKLKIFAKEDGVALMPVKNNAGNEDKKIQLGSEVKEGQVLLDVGDLQGVSVDIYINEVEIQKIKEGDAVKVSGNAFSPIVLNGVVKHIDQQALTNHQVSQLPVFRTQIEVPKLSEEEHRLVKVGMSAKVELTTKDKNQITVPVTSVVYKNGKKMIVKKEKDKEVITEIQTGESDSKVVAVTDGLNQGDQIVVSR
jgi:HlyD family secretion protein